MSCVKQLLIIIFIILSLDVTYSIEEVVNLSSGSAKASPEKLWRHRFRRDYDNFDGVYNPYAPPPPGMFPPYRPRLSRPGQRLWAAPQLTAQRYHKPPTTRRRYPTSFRPIPYALDGGDPKVGIIQNSRPNNTKLTTSIVNRSSREPTLPESNPTQRESRHSKSNVWRHRFRRDYDNFDGVYNPYAPPPPGMFPPYRPRLSRPRQRLWAVPHRTAPPNTRRRYPTSFRPIPYALDGGDPKVGILQHSRPNNTKLTSSIVNKSSMEPTLLESNPTQGESGHSKIHAWHRRLRRDYDNFDGVYNPYAPPPPGMFPPYLTPVARPGQRLWPARQYLGRAKLRQTLPPRLRQPQLIRAPPPISARLQQAYSRSTLGAAVVPTREVNPRPTDTTLPYNKPSNIQGSYPASIRPVPYAFDGGGPIVGIIQNGPITNTKQTTSGITKSTLLAANNTIQPSVIGLHPIQGASVHSQTKHVMPGIVPVNSSPAGYKHRSPLLLDRQQSYTRQPSSRIPAQYQFGMYHRYAEMFEDNIPFPGLAHLPPSPYDKYSRHLPRPLAMRLYEEQSGRVSKHTHQQKKISSVRSQQQVQPLIPMYNRRAPLALALHDRNSPSPISPDQLSMTSTDSTPPIGSTLFENERVEGSVLRAAALRRLLQSQRRRPISKSHPTTARLSGGVGVIQLGSGRGGGSTGGGGVMRGSVGGGTGGGGRGGGHRGRIHAAALTGRRPAARLANSLLMNRIMRGDIETEDLLRMAVMRAMSRMGGAGGTGGIPGVGGRGGIPSAAGMGVAGGLPDMGGMRGAGGMPDVGRMGGAGAIPGLGRSSTIPTTVGMGVAGGMPDVVRMGGTGGIPGVGGMGGAGGMPDVRRMTGISGTSDMLGVGGMGGMGSAQGADSSSPYFPSSIKPLRLLPPFNTNPLATSTIPRSTANSQLESPHITAPKTQQLSEFASLLPTLLGIDNEMFFGFNPFLSTMGFPPQPEFGPINTGQMPLLPNVKPVIPQRRPLVEPFLLPPTTPAPQVRKSPPLPATTVSPGANITEPVDFMERFERKYWEMLTGMNTRHRGPSIGIPIPTRPPQVDLPYYSSPNRASKRPHNTGYVESHRSGRPLPRTLRPHIRHVQSNTPRSAQIQSGVQPLNAKHVSPRPLRQNSPHPNIPTSSSKNPDIAILNLGRENTGIKRDQSKIISDERSLLQRTSSDLGNSTRESEIRTYLPYDNLLPQSDRHRDMQEFGMRSSRMNQRFNGPPHLHPSNRGPPPEWLVQMQAGNVDRQNQRQPPLASRSFSRYGIRRSLSTDQNSQYANEHNAQGHRPENNMHSDHMPYSPYTIPIRPHKHPHPTGQHSQGQRQGMVQTSDALQHPEQTTQADPNDQIVAPSNPGSRYNQLRPNLSPNTSLNHLRDTSTIPPYTKPDNIGFGAGYDIIGPLNPGRVSSSFSDHSDLNPPPALGFNIQGMPQDHFILQESFRTIDNPPIPGQLGNTPTMYLPESSIHRISGPSTNLNRNGLAVDGANSKHASLQSSSSHRPHGSERNSHVSPGVDSRANHGIRLNAQRMQVSHSTTTRHSGMILKGQGIRPNELTNQPRIAQLSRKKRNLEKAYGLLAKLKGGKSTNLTEVMTDVGNMLGLNILEVMERKLIEAEKAATKAATEAAAKAAAAEAQQLQNIRNAIYNTPRMYSAVTGAAIPDPQTLALHGITPTSNTGIGSNTYLDTFTNQLVSIQNGLHTEINFQPNVYQPIISSLLPGSSYTGSTPPPPLYIQPFLANTAAMGTHTPILSSNAIHSDSLYASNLAPSHPGIVNSASHQTAPGNHFYHYIIQGPHIIAPTNNAPNQRTFQMNSPVVSVLRRKRAAHNTTNYPNYNNRYGNRYPQIPVRGYQSYVMPLFTNPSQNGYRRPFYKAGSAFVSMPSYNQYRKNPSWHNPRFPFTLSRGVTSRVYSRSPDKPDTGAGMYSYYQPQTVQPTRRVNIQHIQHESRVPVHHPPTTGIGSKPGQTYHHVQVDLSSIDPVDEKLAPPFRHSNAHASSSAFQLNSGIAAEYINMQVFNRYSLNPIPSRGSRRGSSRTTSNPAIHIHAEQNSLLNFLNNAVPNREPFSGRDAHHIDGRLNGQRQRPEFNGHSSIGLRAGFTTSETNRQPALNDVHMSRQLYGIRNQPAPRARWEIKHHTRQQAHQPTFNRVYGSTARTKPMPRWSNLLNKLAINKAASINRIRKLVQALTSRKFAQHHGTGDEVNKTTLPRTRYLSRYNVHNEPRQGQRFPPPMGRNLLQRHRGNRVNQINQLSPGKPSKSLDRLPLSEIRDSDVRSTHQLSTHIRANMPLRKQQRNGRQRQYLTRHHQHFTNSHTGASGKRHPWLPTSPNSTSVSTSSIPYVVESIPPGNMLRHLDVYSKIIAAGSDKMANVMSPISAKDYTGDQSEPLPSNRPVATHISNNAILMASHRPGTTHISNNASLLASHRPGTGYVSNNASLVVSRRPWTTHISTNASLVMHAEPVQDFVSTQLRQRVSSSTKLKTLFRPLINDSKSRVLTNTTHSNMKVEMTSDKHVPENADSNTTAKSTVLEVTAFNVTLEIGPTSPVPREQNNSLATLWLDMAISDDSPGSSDGSTMVHDQSSTGNSARSLFVLGPLILLFCFFVSCGICVLYQQWSVRPIYDIH